MELLRAFVASPGLSVAATLALYRVPHASLAESGSHISSLPWELAH